MNFKPAQDLFSTRGNKGAWPPDLNDYLRQADCAPLALGVDVDPEVSTLKTRSVMLLIGAGLLLASCVAPPAFFATKFACTTSDREFSGPLRDGSLGLSDLAEVISEETVIRMLAKRQLAFFEQSLSSAVGPARVFSSEFPDARFLRFSLVPGNPGACIASHNHIRYGVLYDLYESGMRPDECLAALPVPALAGRFVLESSHSSSFGADLLKLKLRDRSSEIESTEILSARSRRISSSYINVSLQFAAACQGDPQSLGAAFAIPVKPAEPVESRRPPTAIRLTRQSSGRILEFSRTPMSGVEIRRLSKESGQGKLTVASKSYRAILVDDTKFLAHWDLTSWSGCKPTLIALNDGVLILGWEPDGVSISYV